MRRPMRGSTSICAAVAICFPRSRGACRWRATPTNSLRTHRRCTTSGRIYSVTANPVGKGIDSVQALGVAIEGEVAKRSEEHTSELQSLMRISYAVFCLKKKNTQHQTCTLTYVQYTLLHHTY